MRRTTFAGLAVAAALGRPAVERAKPHAGPAPPFADAVASIEALIAREAADPLLAATSRPRLYHHGRAVDDAVVLYHGFTNCPEQFDELARSLFARGANVYVPRLPLHGYRDRLTRALGGLTSAHLADCAGATYHVTRGLGRAISALGLSVGGSMALYLAQTQPIDHAVAVAPFLMPIGVPVWAGVPLMSAVSWLPDRYLWWDPRAKEHGLPLYAYPGFPTHALAQCIFFAEPVVTSRAAPRAKRCTVVTNAHETAVNNRVATDRLDAWRHAGAPYDGVVLTDLGEPRHDIIDPTTFPAARVLVYPKLEAIVLG